MGAVGPLELLIVLIGVAVTWILTSKRFNVSKTVVRVALILVALVTIVVAVTGRRARTKVVEQDITSPDVGSLELRLSNFAAGFNQSLPMPVDSTTTLQSAFTDGKTLIYQYTLAVDPSSLPGAAGIETLFKPALQQKACQAPEMVDFLSLGVVLRHRFADQQGMPLGDLFITDADCR